MILICNECFNEFEGDEDLDDVCDNCVTPELTSDKCVHVFKIFSSRGFKNQEEIDFYKTVKKAYFDLTGKSFMKLEEKIKKGK